MSNSKTKPSLSLVEAASSPVKLQKVEAVSTQQIMLVISLVTKLINFIEGPMGQKILTHIKESTGLPFKAKVRALASLLLEAATAGEKHVK